MNALSHWFAQSMLSQADRLSYGELAVLADWLYADLPEAEKEPGQIWEIAHHVEMARLWDSKNYVRMRALVARVEIPDSAIRAQGGRSRGMVRNLPLYPSAQKGG